MQLRRQKFMDDIVITNEREIEGEGYREGGERLSWRDGGLYWEEEELNKQKKYAVQYCSDDKETEEAASS